MNSAHLLTKPRKTVQLMSVTIDSSQKADLLKHAENYLKTKQTFFVVTPNPEIILAAQSDMELKNALNSADISIPDGVGVLFAAKFLGLDIKRRIQGRVFMEDLFGIADRRNLSVYLLGSTDAVIGATLSRLRREYPHLQSAGNAGPKLGHDAKPVNKEERDKETEVIQEINLLHPDLLFVGFGAPKQEKWFYAHRDKLKIGGAMVVGGSFDVYSGLKKAPPAFFQNWGIEWIWRLFWEPTRFFRILKATVVFPLMIIIEKIHNIFI